MRGGGEDRAGLYLQLADRRLGPDVEAVRLVDRRLVEHALADHPPGAAHALFRGLKREAHAAAQPLRSVLER